jgi:hypothetical protein
MAALTYESPLPARRPYKSFRFDVFSLKAGRRITLYGKAAVSQFIELEADHEVSALCERPLKIPDLKPERNVDFWALRGGRPHYYLLLSKSGALDAEKPKPAMEDFRKWVQGERGVLHEVVVDVFNERRIHHSNWTTILQHLVAHRGQVTSTLLERLAIELPSRFTLAQIESQAPDIDAMLVRAGIFTLLANGSLRCPTIGKQHLYPLTELVRP